jgi:hypothetical protein
VSREDDIPTDDIVFVDTGSGQLAALHSGGANPGPPSRSSRGRPRTAFALTAVVVVAVVVALVNRSPSHRPGATPTGSPSPAPGSSSPRGSTLPIQPVSVTNIGHPLLGVTQAWEVFGRAAGVVVRVEMARGQITRTTVPALGTTGPVSFLATPDGAIVRPLDSVPGYAVPDGQPPRELAGLLTLGGPVITGPDPRHVWIANDDGVESRVSLVSTDGKPAGESILLPADANSYPRSDGSGGVLLTTADGVYQGRSGPLKRISTGDLLAIGPTGWLVRECASRSCETVLISQDGGSRHTVPVSFSQPGRVGLVSPDGQTAAVLDQYSPSGSTLELVDLVAGRLRPVQIVVDPAASDSLMAWSPDNRWLFVVGAGGRLLVIDATAGTAGELIRSLPDVRQLAIRD